MLSPDIDQQKCQLCCASSSCYQNYRIAWTVIDL